MGRGWTTADYQSPAPVFCRPGIFRYLWLLHGAFEKAIPASTDLDFLFEPLFPIDRLVLDRLRRDGAANDRNAESSISRCEF